MIQDITDKHIFATELEMNKAGVGSVSQEKHPEYGVPINIQVIDSDFCINHNIVERTTFSLDTSDNPKGIVFKYQGFAYVLDKKETNKAEKAEAKEAKAEAKEAKAEALKAKLQAKYKKEESK